MKWNKRLLVAVDDSDASRCAVEYVGAMIDGSPEFFVCLLHVLPVLPPHLLEFAGSENAELEETMDAEIENKQSEWLSQAKLAAQPLLEQATEVLRAAQVPAQAITTQFALASNVDALVRDIIKAAEMETCHTIVVGRETFTTLEKIFKKHVADELIRRCPGHTVWVIQEADG